MATKAIGILTSGDDCPGLNAVIRGVGKAVCGAFDHQPIGFLDGLRGLVENRTIHLDHDALSEILTLGGTIPGTSRDKPHKMPVGGWRAACKKKPGWNRGSPPWGTCSVVGCPHRPTVCWLRVWEPGVPS